MKNIAVVYHSASGATKVQALEILNGLRSLADIKAKIFNIADLKDPALLNDYDGIIFGSPTFFGGVSAEFKSFIDSCSSIWYSKLWSGKLAAGFTTSGSISGDKFATLTSLVTFACQQSMVWVPQMVNPFNPETTGLNPTGTSLGLVGTNTNMQGEGDMSPEDKKTAYMFGKLFGQFALSVDFKNK